MDELIDIVDEFGAFTGKQALKSEAHRLGWFHNTIHLWLFTSDGRILLAQRSRKKTICPLLWDVSAAGHIDAGEAIQEAAIRETQEELGLVVKVDALIPVGVYKHMSAYDDLIYDNEFHHTFITKMEPDLDRLVLNADEVEAVKLVDKASFEELLENSETNGHFVPTNKPYYLDVLKAVQDFIQI